jgi:hypothetical protein
VNKLILILLLSLFLFGCVNPSQENSDNDKHIDVLTIICADGNIIQYEAEYISNYIEYRVFTGTNKNREEIWSVTISIEDRALVETDIK